MWLWPPVTKSGAWAPLKLTDYLRQVFTCVVSWLFGLSAGLHKNSWTDFQKTSWKKKWLIQAAGIYELVQFDVGGTVCAVMSAILVPWEINRSVEKEKYYVSCNCRENEKKSVDPQQKLMRSILLSSIQVSWKIHALFPGKGRKSPSSHNIKESPCPFNKIYTKSW